MGKYLTVEQAGERLGISRATAYRWAKEGKLPAAFRGTRSTRIPAAQLAEMIDAEAARNVATEANCVATETRPRDIPCDPVRRSRGKVERIA